MKKVFNTWFKEPIFLKFSPADGRIEPVDPSQTLFGKGFLPGAEPSPCGASLLRVYS
jgi:hypothetical protein